MKTKMKTTLFTLFILFVLTTSLHAQDKDKYEYAIVNHLFQQIYVSTSQTSQQFPILKGEDVNVGLLK